MDIHSNYQVIIVDDDDDDIFLIHDALRYSSRKIEVRAVHNGVELMDYLNRLVETRGKPGYIPPGLIFLDINMPLLNGFDTLREIRKHPDYSCVPVIMLTTARDRETIDICYEIGAVGYLSKQDPMSELDTKLDAVITYWFEAVHHPILK